MFIDNDAKLRITLFRQTDTHGAGYYTGKLQFPGTIDFEKGASFMVFTAEEEGEELQLSPVDETRRSPRIKSTAGQARPDSLRMNGRMRIQMHPCTDKEGNIFYVGEVEYPASISCTDGLYFTFFNSMSNKEELQIARLRKKEKKYYNSDEPQYSLEDDSSSGRAPVRQESYSQRNGGIDYGNNDGYDREERKTH